MLWVDKYRPNQLDKLDYHGDLTDQLRRMASKESVNRMSHLLFYGPSGAGKKTRVSNQRQACRTPAHQLGELTRFFCCACCCRHVSKILPRKRTNGAWN